MSYAVVGIDPSSRLVACVTTLNTKQQEGVVTEVKAIRMPPKQPQRTCWLAYVGLRRYLKELSERVDQIGVFIEAPTLVGRAGAKALIPQAQVNGALLVAASSVSQVVVIENVPITQWKKQIVGNGNANKSQIAAWCKRYWTDAYALADGTQDFYDAAGINRFGDNVMRIINSSQKG